MGSMTSSIVPYDEQPSSPCSARMEPPPPPNPFPDYVSAPVEALHREFIESSYNLILNYSLFWQQRRTDPPVHFRKPEDLLLLIDSELGSSGTDQFQLLTLVRKILYYSPTSAHPYYMYYPLAGLDPYSVIGDFVASNIPSTMLHYRDGPVYSLMEKEISKKLCQLAGYPEGTGDCIFPYGCATCNAFSILLARHNKFPNCREKGIMDLPPMVIFISQDGHGSYKKGAVHAGIGLDNVITVMVDSKGKMSVSHLIRCVNEAIKLGKTPLMVGATSGTNIFGAFDPLEDISKVCKQYDMWLHSDGALGGGLIFSPTQRSLRLKGMELCDSFAGNFHKFGSATQVSTFMMTPHDTILSDVIGVHRECHDHSSFKHDNPSSVHSHSEPPTYHKYNDHIRRPDIVKLFMMWQGKGLHGLGANIDDAYERAQFFLEELKRRQILNGKFVPLLEEFEAPMVTFYYVPIYLHSLDRNAAQFKERLDLHTSFMLAELINSGIMVVTVQSHRNSPLFFKIVLHNSSLTNKDVVYLIDQLDNHGSFLRVPFETPNFSQF